MDERFTLEYLAGKDEKPLDRIAADGGFCSIFRTMAVIGDSLSSGEFETKLPDGKTSYNDIFDYSWGQYIARMCGSRVYNFSKGGMTAAQYMQSFAAERGYWDPALAAQAYIIALGCNDFNHDRFAAGDVASDVFPDDPEKNANTFAGWYGRIVSSYKAISPDAKFFFVTMVKNYKPEFEAKVDKQTKVLYDLCGFFPNCYVIDLGKYGEKYGPEFKEMFYLHGHMNPAGYVYTAKIIASYIDYIIRHNMRDFCRVGYIGTGLSDSEMLKKYGVLDLG